MTLMCASASTALLPELPELADGALLRSGETTTCERDCLRDAAQALVLNTNAKNARPPFFQGLAANTLISCNRSCMVQTSKGTGRLVMCSTAVQLRHSEPVG